MDTRSVFPHPTRYENRTLVSVRILVTKYQLSRMKRPEEDSIEKKKCHLIQDGAHNKYNTDPMSNSAVAPFK